MANPTSIFGDFATRYDSFLTQAVSDGTNASLFQVLKKDEIGKEAPASLIFQAGGQLWSNGVDDFISSAYQKHYSSQKLWGRGSLASLQALGIDDGLLEDDLGQDQATNLLYYVVSVDGAASSTWAVVPVSGASLPNPLTSPHVPNADAERFGAASSADAARATALGSSAAADFVDSVALGHAAATVKASQLMAGSSAAPLTEMVLGNGETNAAPQAIIFRGSNAIGTDIAGADLCFGASRGTGAADGGHLFFRTSRPGASGSILNAAVDRISVRADTGFTGINKTVPATIFHIDAAAEVPELRVEGDGTNDASLNLVVPGEAAKLSLDSITGAMLFGAGISSDSVQFAADAPTDSMHMDAVGRVGFGDVPGTGASQIQGIDNATLAEPLALWNKSRTLSDNTSIGFYVGDDGGGGFQDKVGRIRNKLTGNFSDAANSNSALFLEVMQQGVLRAPLFLKGDGLLQISAPTAGAAQLQLFEEGFGGSFSQIRSSAGELQLGNVSNAAAIRIQAGAPDDAINILPSGFVGIGGTPTEQLHVFGDRIVCETAGAAACLDLRTASQPAWAISGLNTTGALVIGNPTTAIVTVQKAAPGGSLVVQASGKLKTESSNTGIQIDNTGEIEQNTPLTLTGTAAVDVVTMDSTNYLDANYTRITNAIRVDEAGPGRYRFDVRLDFLNDSAIFRSGTWSVNKNGTPVKTFKWTLDATAGDVFSASAVVTMSGLVANDLVTISAVHTQTQASGSVDAENGRITVTRLGML